MNAHARRARPVLAALLLALAAPAFADPFAPAGPGGPAFGPAVPVSALARPAAWFDPSRLSITTAVAVGSGFGGAVHGLQTTSLTYRFERPIWMRVSVGNAWGPAAAAGDGRLFLEGFDLGFKPLPSMFVNVQYRDLRSPLQLSRTDRLGSLDW